MLVATCLSKQFKICPIYIRHSATSLSRYVRDLANLFLLLQSFLHCRQQSLYLHNLNRFTYQSLSTLSCLLCSPHLGRILELVSLAPLNGRKAHSPLTLSKEVSRRHKNAFGISSHQAR